MAPCTMNIAALQVYHSANAWAVNEWTSKIDVIGIDIHDLITFYVHIYYLKTII